ncbi:30S ribosomal protein S8e [Nitrososphaera sp. AFS]|uniref:30S ribosomal protein S8e n=1 Tax=Nitrososphaera sp. AFS TaxID=2301191 RepID=UPI0013923F81|nr:30S ribosomal protein S8e [Nitrososphaera sp. AFS]NAL76869.1 30S ribosomal protein S8e [Nitrososphaera sp. AFS]
MRKSLENLAKRKPSGGRRIASRSRRSFEIDRYPNEASLGTTTTVTRRTRGNDIKASLKTAETVNVTNPASRRTTKLLIKNVIKNPANKDYERRGVISKGALLETDQGMARVVSRPGQDGSVNAVLVQS